ncbi:MAG: hypothetical protein MUE40_04610 [Anaerolineae bacterium]|nr:hypothetical protein [Anaerolineae bacterium]
MAHLLNVDHALEQILARIGICPAETVPLNAALTRILAQEVTARASLPPFASSGMDGFAVRVADVAAAQDAAPSRLRVVEDIPAGTAPQHTLQPGECARIMTGAPVRTCPPCQSSSRCLSRCSLALLSARRVKISPPGKQCCTPGSRCGQPKWAFWRPWAKQP